MSFGLVPECSSFAVRKDPPSVFEYTAAEWWVRECYARYFRTSFPYPQLITWQLQRFFFNYDPLDPVLDLVMSLLENDFRNILSPRLVKRFFALAKANAPEAELLALLKEITPGGALKPDMLGISAARTLYFDGVEVGTVKTAKSTWDELNSKLGIIKDVIVPQLKLMIPGLAEKWGKGIKSISVPTDFVVKASSFRLNRWERILPLPVKITRSGKVRYADWICYHPTMTWSPSGVAPGALGPEGPQGTDGLVIYHIHRAPIPDLPDKVRLNLEIELRKWRQGQNLVLELNPAYAYSFQQSKNDWSPEARQLMAYFGVGVIVLLGLTVAWEAGLIAGAAIIAEEGLMGLAAAPQLLGTALMDGAAIAQRLWPAAVTFSHFLPMPQE